MTYARHIPLQGSFNLRDLGGYPATDGPTVWRQHWRADSLHRLDADAIAALTGMGCCMVIDLRHDAEIAERPNPFARGLNGVSYHHVSLFEGLDPAQPRIADADDVLLTLYCAALTERRAQFAEVLRLISTAPGGTLFHCTAGKDRTGIIAAFLLSLAGVSRQDIVADYALTEKYAAPMFAALRAEQDADGVLADAINPSSPLLLSDAATMEAFLDHLDHVHDGAEAYLRTCGLHVEEIARLRKRLLRPILTEGVA